MLSEKLKMVPMQARQDEQRKFSANEETAAMKRL
jgi:hypothetical protein